MNWPEHLRVIHRLTGKNLFYFKSGDDRPEILLTKQGFWVYWHNPDPTHMGSFRLVDQLLNEKLNSLPDLEIVKAQ